MLLNQNTTPVIVSIGSSTSFPLWGFAAYLWKPQGKTSTTPPNITCTPLATSTGNILAAVFEVGDELPDVPVVPPATFQTIISGLVNVLFPPYATSTTDAVQLNAGDSKPIVPAPAAGFINVLGTWSIALAITANVGQLSIVGASSGKSYWSVNVQDVTTTGEPLTGVFTNTQVTEELIATLSNAPNPTGHIMLTLTYMTVPQTSGSVVSSGITQVTSNDGSIEVTNPIGPIIDLAILSIAKALANTITTLGVSIQDTSSAGILLEELGTGTLELLAGIGSGGITLFDSSGQGIFLQSTTGVFNAWIHPRPANVAQAAIMNINTNNADIFTITGLAQNSTINASGTPSDGDKMEIRITDNGTARTLTWGAVFIATTVALPTTTVASTRLRVSFEWDNAASKWACIGTA